jgi:hypothetical protein
MDLNDSVLIFRLTQHFSLGTCACDDAVCIPHSLLSSSIPLLTPHLAKRLKAVADAIMGLG